MAHRIYCEPAASVIDRCGGVLPLAKVIGCSASWVYRWRFKGAGANGGTGGRVPYSVRPLIVQASRDGRLPPGIVFDDFEPPELRSTPETEPVKEAAAVA